MKETLKTLVDIHDGNKYFISKELKVLSEMSKEDLDAKIIKFKYVFVADNPGEEEIADKENVIYLNSNGQAGKNFENFLKWLGIERKDCMIMNKTIKHTKLTENLGDDLDWNSQSEVAYVINEIIKVNPSIKVCLLGFTDFYNTNDKSLFRDFYSKLNGNDCFRAYHHPSRRQLFTLSEQKEIEEADIDKIEYFDFVGKEQFKDRKKENNNYLKRYKDSQGGA